MEIESSFEKNVGNPKLNTSIIINHCQTNERLWNSCSNHSFQVNAKITKIHTYFSWSSDPFLNSTSLGCPSSRWCEGCRLYIYIFWGYVLQNSSGKSLGINVFVELEQFNSVRKKKISRDDILQFLRWLNSTKNFTFGKASKLIESRGSRRSSKISCCCRKHWCCAKECLTVTRKIKSYLTFHYHKIPARQKYWAESPIWGQQ